jgi:hypothetical protein
VAFVDPALWKSGFLELPINIAREHERPTRHAVRPSAAYSASILSPFSCLAHAKRRERFSYALVADRYSRIKR